MIEYITQLEYKDDEEMLWIVDELTRCKDCIFCDKELAFGRWYGVCTFSGRRDISVMANDFCSKGDKDEL